MLHVYMYLKKRWGVAMSCAHHVRERRLGAVEGADGLGERFASALPGEKRTRFVRKVSHAGGFALAAQRRKQRML